MIAAGQFKARCLSLIDQVSQTHQVITITKRGKPVARLRWRRRNRGDCTGLSRGTLWRKATS